MVSVGTVVWLSSELMFFAGLFAMYFTLRSTSGEMWAMETEKLNVPVRVDQHHHPGVELRHLPVRRLRRRAAPAAAHRRAALLGRWGMVEWFLLTFFMGAIFVAVQAYEYAELVAEGIALSSNAFGSAFYITTGFHGIHVVGGLIAFLFIIGRAFIARQFGHFEATSAIVTSYYWHFVDVVWIGLFIIIYFLQ
jgi:cytochrome c oxidase subunit 3